MVDLDWKKFSIAWLICSSEEHFSIEKVSQGREKVIICWCKVGRVRWVVKLNIQVQEFFFWVAFAIYDYIKVESFSLILYNWTYVSIIIVKFEFKNSYGELYNPTIDTIKSFFHGCLLSNLVEVVDPYQAIVFYRQYLS